MRKKSCNKGLLLPWLLEALNKQTYEGLRWSDKQRKIFYVLWTHKSAEQWSKNDVEPFEAWAALKGKLIGKNEKQLKATFRCALNSKKELKEVYRNRSKRYWQFVDPRSNEEGSTNKQKRRKLNTSLTDTDSQNDIINNSFGNCPPSRMCSSGEAEIFGSHKLPSFASFCNYVSLNSQYEANEIFFDFTEPDEDKYSKKKRRKSNSKLLNDMTHDMSDMSTSNISSSFSSCLPSVTSSAETENSTADKLPSFQSFYSFEPLTPPHQENETLFNYSDYRTNYTPPSDQSRLTPPAELPPKNYHNTSRYNTSHQLSTDVWHPNCWSICNTQQDFNGVNQFFSNDFDEMNKSSRQNLDMNRIDFLESDQYVPVMNVGQCDQVFSRNGDFNSTSNKTAFENNLSDQVKLDDDYYLFSNDINQEACEKIMQELNRISPTSEIGSYSYSE